MNLSKVGGQELDAFGGAGVGRRLRRTNIGGTHAARESNHVERDEQRREANGNPAENPTDCAVDAFLAALDDRWDSQSDANADAKNSDEWNPAQHDRER